MKQNELLLQYQQEVRHHLVALTDQLVPELAVIAHAEQPEDTYLLDFEVHSDGFADGFPVYWDPMSADASQLEGRTELLSSTAHTLPNELVNGESYDAAGINPWSEAFQLLVVWFGECWHKAGGLECVYPAYICHHDDIESYDLQTLKWVSDNEKWPI